MHNINGNFVYAFGCLGAFMTAIYSTRVICLAFHGNSKIDNIHYKKIKESPKSMIFPLAILSIGAIFSGYIFHNIVEYNEFWKGGIYFQNDINFVKQAHQIPFIFKKIPIFLVVTAIVITMLFYLYSKKEISFNKNFKSLFKFFENKWYIDELYQYIFAFVQLRSSDAATFCDCLKTFIKTF